MMKSFRAALASLAVLAPLALATPALADFGPYSFTTLGDFQNVQETGYYYDLAGDLVLDDIADDAAWDVGDIPTGGRYLIWGDSVDPDAAYPHSYIEFRGVDVVDATPFGEGTSGDVFLLGTLTYYNGTSDLGTLVYGTTLFVDTNHEDIDDLFIELRFLATQNTDLDPERDADFITFSVGGTGALSAASSFHVYEGQTAFVSIYGSLYGDPQFFYEFIDLDPGQTGGFLGDSSLPAIDVPEPSTWAMMILGFGAVGFAMRRRRGPAFA